MKKKNKTPKISDFIYIKPWEGCRYGTKTKVIKSAEEVIKDITDALNEASGSFIEDIANQVLVGNFEYLGDSTFEVEKVEIDF